jgi:hypothetical protein
MKDRKFAWSFDGRVSTTKIESKQAKELIPEEKNAIAMRDSLILDTKTPFKVYMNKIERFFQANSVVYGSRKKNYDLITKSIDLDNDLTEYAAPEEYKEELLRLTPAHKTLQTEAIELEESPKKARRRGPRRSEWWKEKCVRTYEYDADVVRGKKKAERKARAFYESVPSKDIPRTGLELFSRTLRKGSNDLQQFDD